MKKPWETNIVVYTSEAALLEGLRRQERDACTCLLKQFSSMVYKLAVRMLGENDDAEDVLQESFIKACKSITTFEGRSGLGTWLHQITFTTALMWQRRKKPDTLSLYRLLDDEQGSLVETIGNQERDVSEQILEGELHEIIEKALFDIPPSLRTAFLLRDIKELSTGEAADVLGITESALKVRLHRARLALRHKLASYFERTKEG